MTFRPRAYERGSGLPVFPMIEIIHLAPSGCATKPLAQGIPGRVGAQTRIANSALSVRRNIGDGPRCDQIPRLDVVNLEFPIGIVPSPKILLASRISARTALRRCSGVLTLFSCLRAALRPRSKSRDASR